MSSADAPVSIELFAYPWDIADRGPARFAEECRNLGVTRLHVTSLYHSGKFLLPRNEARRVYFAESGMAYVPLNAAKFDKLKPVFSPLAEIGWLEQLAGKGIPLSAWTVFHHNSRLGSIVPQWTVRNLFGDHYPFALCPSHEEIRDYSLLLATELARLGFFDTLDLETIGFLGYFHGHHHEVAAGPLGPFENFLLSLCFCAACRAAAIRDGIAVDELARQLRELVLLKLQSDDSNGSSNANTEQIATLLAQTPELVRFVQMRVNRVTELVQDIAAAVSPLKIGVFTSSFVGSPSNIWMEGVSIPRLRDAVEVFHLLAYTPDTGAVNDDLLFCLSQMKDADKLNLTLNLGLPITPALSDAAAKLLFARKQGVRRFSFFNYGFLGEARLQWVAELAYALRDGKTASSQG
jgi:hypothetical protein